MISSIGSTVSALNAYEKKMGVISNNVANSQSEEFKKSRADLNEGVNGSVEVEISQIETPGPIVMVEEEDGMVEKEMSNVNLVEEIAQTIPTEKGYKANLKMLKVQDEMLGSLLDIIG